MTDTEPAPGSARPDHDHARWIIDLSMVGNTGTYLDAPYHRYTDSTDLAELPRRPGWLNTAPPWSASMR